MSLLSLISNSKHIVDPLPTCGKKLLIGAAAIIPLTIINNSLLVLSFRKEIDASETHDWKKIVAKINKQNGFSKKVNARDIAENILLAPIGEELLFRGIFQSLLLTITSRLLLVKIAPSYATLMDTNPAKIARIGLVALTFGLAHLVNKKALGKAATTRNVILAFFGGILFGTLKESKIGLLGAIGAHMMNNILCCFPLMIDRPFRKKSIIPTSVPAPRLT